MRRQVAVSVPNVAPPGAIFVCGGAIVPAPPLKRAAGSGTQRALDFRRAPRERTDRLSAGRSVNALQAGPDPPARPARSSEDA